MSVEGIAPEEGLIVSIEGNVHTRLRPDMSFDTMDVTYYDRNLHEKTIFMTHENSEEFTPGNTYSVTRIEEMQVCTKTKQDTHNARSNSS